MMSGFETLSADAAGALDELCRELGVEPLRGDGEGQRRAPLETVLAALRSLGAPLAGPEDAADALRAVRRERAGRMVPPAAVSWTDEPPSLPFRFPEGAAGEPLELEVLFEDGDRAVRRAEPDELAATPGSLPLPPLLPGYHEVRLRKAGGEERALVIRAPRRCWQPGDGDAGRRWGGFLPLHALRTERDLGVGDLSDLRSLADRLGNAGGSLVGTLPLYDTFLGERGPFDPSPYAPVSRLFWNPLWIALDEVPGLDRSPRARELLWGSELAGRREALRGSERVDYRGAMALKREVLEALARARPGEGPHGLDVELSAWVRDDPEALVYARFRAAVEASGTTWSGWQGAARDGDPGALHAPDDAVRYHVFGQWVLEEQLNRLASGSAAPLYLDLPLASHPEGFDAWRYREIFAPGFTVGAPPDLFYEGGQDWSFPPLHPERTRLDGHGYWAACLRGAMAVAGALRLDHVMALHRLFWIPAGGTAAEGVYVRYPHDELWAVLSLESHRHRCEVVGEDLGTVPPEVPRAMREHGATRMWVLPFELAASEEPPGYRVNPPGPGVVASLDTHDLPPFAAFFTGTDIEQRAAAGDVPAASLDAERQSRAEWRGALVALLADTGLMDPATSPDSLHAGAALEATLAYLAGSEAGMVLIGLENLWLEAGRQNLPGTPATENWRLKARLSLEEMMEDERVRELLRLVDRSRREPLTHPHQVPQHP